ncbi:MFS transporter [Streptomyces graminilatus]|uniref:MFS transporter n=1 Tax=Streptomyces graminilatus TaxID=1464070 RepID=UPI00099E8DC7|nr:MFS transporter [Streptomyces graminilatus]
MSIADDHIALRTKLPRTYLLWLGGAFTSQLGDAAMYFALGWAATAHGGGAAGLVLTSVALPRTLLLLLGGAVADRFSPRRILILGDSMMVAMTVGVALTAYARGSTMWLLLGAGVIIGTIDAFYLPVSGSMPRRLVGADNLDRAVGLSQSGSQLISLVGGSVGGALVTAGGLTGAAVFDGVTFAFAVLVAVLIRPRFEVPPPAERTNLLREAAQGVTFSLRHPVLRPALLLTGGVAGFAIPVGSLLVPLLARENHWGAQVAGVVLGGEALGALVVALLVARWGAFRLPGVVAALSVVPMALGIAVLGQAHQAPVAVSAGACFGLGLGLFVTHLGPVMLGASPVTHLARVQALITLVQSLVLVVTLNLLGQLADVVDAFATALVCAAVLAGAGVLALLSSPLRRATMKQPQQDGQDGQDEQDGDGDGQDEQDEQVRQGETV